VHVSQKLILYNVAVLDYFWSPVVQCFATEDAVWWDGGSYPGNYVNKCDIPLLLKCDVITPARKSCLPSWRLEAGCIPTFHRHITQQRVDMSHCSLLKAVRPEQFNGESPFLFFRWLSVTSLSCDTVSPRWSSPTATSALSLIPAPP
jgi:hypothetical protein